MNVTARPRVFLAHTNADKPLVREVYHLLKSDGFEPWLDVENLVSGQDWNLEILEAIKASDAMAIILSDAAIGRKGYLNKEISTALDQALLFPDGEIFILPVIIGEIEVPRKLSNIQAAMIPRNLCNSPRIFQELQKALNFKAASMHPVSKGENKLINIHTSSAYDLHMKPGKYVVFGENSDGSIYFGTSTITIEGEKLKMATTVGHQCFHYDQGVVNRTAFSEQYAKISAARLNNLSFQPNHAESLPHTTFNGLVQVSYRNGVYKGSYEGVWGQGGLEILLPSSTLTI